jgi:hypothetical protein
MKRGFRFLQFFSTAIGLCVLAAGASGAVLKSVQSNTQTMVVAGVPVTTVNVNLPTPVIASNAFVICQADTGGVTSNPTARATCELNSNTQLTITISVTDPSATPLAVRWYVAEFLSGVSVQRGLANFAAATLTTPVALGTAVNLASSFVLVTERMNSPTQTIDQQWTVRAQLTTINNLQLTRNASGTAVSVAWQAIQIDSAAVQPGIAPLTTTILANALTATAALAPSVDTKRTFLVFSHSAGSATGGDERLYRVTGQITAPNTITFTRALSGAAGTQVQVDIVWYAVRMTDGTTVQNSIAAQSICGPSGTGAASATMPALPAGCLTIPTVIATNQSIALLSARGDAASGTGTADLDDTSWRSTLAPAGNAIVLNRSAGSSLSTNATVAWQVVQFNNTTNTIDRVEIVP